MTALATAVEVAAVSVAAVWIPQVIAPIVVVSKSRQIAPKKAPLRHKASNFFIIFSYLCISGWSL